MPRAARRTPFALEALEERRLMAAVPPGFADQTLVTGLNVPTSADVLPDGRVLVTEKGGTLRVIKNRTLLNRPALTIRVSVDSEKGLLGVVADPDFKRNRFIYLFYTTPGGVPNNSRVVRYTMAGDVVKRGSAFTLTTLDALHQGNHIGGGMHFGTDGKLYISTGENAVAANAQTLDNRHGKILRINRDGTIPADNPFYNVATGDNRQIWALGLRNPFSFAVQPGTGRILINDVGANTYEEINDGIAGANYGWPETEGPTADPRFVAPVHFYDHSNGSNSIVAGAFYNPPKATFPRPYAGSYFFSDLSGGYIKRLVFRSDNSVAAVRAFATSTGSMVDLDVARDGSLYYLNIVEGQLGRIRYTGAGAPKLITGPRSQTASAGMPVTFAVYASGAGLQYQWLRNGAIISGATRRTYTLPSAKRANDGDVFRVRIANAAGSLLSPRATLTVT